MKRKALALLTAFLLTINLVSTTAFAAAPSIELSTNAAGSLKAGETVTVTIVVPAISEHLAAAEIGLDFDKAVFEATEITGGPLPVISDATSTNSFLITPLPTKANSDGFVHWADMTAMLTNELDCTAGRTVTATFKVKEGAAFGPHSFSLSAERTNFRQCDNKGKYTSEEFVTLPSAVTVSVISTLPSNLPISITAPTTGGTPVTNISGTNFTGSITWSPTVSGTFAASTVYTANVTLTANTDYQFASDVNPAVTGATISDKSVSSDGKTLTFKAKFDATGSLPAASVDTAPTPKTGLKYDCTKQELVTKGTATGGTM